MRTRPSSVSHIDVAPLGGAYAKSQSAIKYCQVRILSQSMI